MSAVVAHAPGTLEQPQSRASLLSVIKQPNVQILAASRIAAKLALATLSYGAMVYLARQDASQFQISLVSSAGYLSALLLGVRGGIAADSLPKRLAITGGYLLQAIVCLAIPFLWGTTVPSLVVAMLLTSAIMQIVSPGLKSMVAIVSTPAELATTGAFVSIAGSIGSAIGSSFLAPVLIKASGIKAVFIGVALIFLFGAIRAIKLPSEERAAGKPTAQKAEWHPRALSFKDNATWLIQNRSIGSMVLIGAVVVAIFESFNTLLPVYVREVLKADPANAIYIFAPAGLGFLFGTMLGPLLIRVIGERRLAIVSFILIALGNMFFAVINHVSPFFARFSPLRLLSVFDIHFSERILAAGVIAIFANFGSTCAGAAVQTYINRVVPVIRQGATFGLQEMQENGLALVSVIVLGAVANVVGPQVVFLLAPPIILGLVLMAVNFSYRSASGAKLSRGQTVEALFSADDPDFDVIITNDPPIDPPTEPGPET